MKNTLIKTLINQSLKVVVSGLHTVPESALSTLGRNKSTCLSLIILGQYLQANKDFTADDIEAAKASHSFGGDVFNI